MIEQDLLDSLKEHYLDEPEDEVDSEEEMMEPMTQSEIMTS